MTNGLDFYITTAISYPNGEPHIGHAYEAIAADTLARFERYNGKNVYFLTGTDEHGLKMQQTAAKNSLSPHELAEKNSGFFKKMVNLLNLSHDDFIRTSEQRHYRSAKEIWKRMSANGDIYTGKYSGWYSVSDEAFYSEKETTICNNGVRYGPQKTVVEWQEEDTYFFRLSSYEQALLTHYNNNPDFILPLERRNEVINFVKGGLQDLSISRSTLNWGIPVPNSHNHIMYVWIDALTSYLTGLGFPDEGAKNWKLWPASLHVIGKDIVRFHAVYWPAILMSAGLPLPKRIFAHGFMLNKGEKMSKSIGNTINPFNLVSEFGVDQIRYYFLREVTFGQDGNYSPELIENRINADLSNDIGNLAQRSLSMIAKNCAAVIPEPANLSPKDQAILAAADGIYQKAYEAMDRQAIKKYLDVVWEVVAKANRYFAGEEPWVKSKTDPARMNTILYVTAEVVRQIAILAQPAVPSGAAKLLDLLSIPQEQRMFSALGPKGRLKPGTVLPKPQGIFPRYVSSIKKKTK